MYSRLALNLWQSFCLSFLGAVITGLNHYHHIWLSACVLLFTDMTSTMRMKRWRQETIGEILEFTINVYLFLTVKLNKEHGNELAVNLIMPEGNISSCSPDGPPSVLLLYWLVLCFFVCLFGVLVFWQSFSVSLWLSLLCRRGWPQTHRDPPVSASRVLGLKVHATRAQQELEFNGADCYEGWLQTHRDPPASASWVLGSKGCATITWLKFLKLIVSTTVEGEYCVLRSHMSLSSILAMSANFYTTQPLSQSPEEQDKHTALTPKHR